MPILVRPVREQLEHDRVIRLLQAKYKRKFEVGMNQGAEEVAPVGAGASALYPDLVLQSAERSKKLLGVVEVETGESVNNLEAMAQWRKFGGLRAPFHLYVPSNMLDVARRLCQDLQIPVAEVWTYHPVGDQIRFTLVQRVAMAGEKPARSEVERPARPEPPHVEPAQTARGDNLRRPARATGATRRPAVTANTRRKPATKARVAKTAPARGRVPAAKKKAVPARSARTQKRK
jgi:hypothetical protein